MIMDDEVEGQSSILRKPSGSQPRVPLGNRQNRLRTKATESAPKSIRIRSRCQGEPSGSEAPEPAPPTLRPKSELPISRSRQAARRMRNGRPSLHNKEFFRRVVLKKPQQQAGAVGATLHGYVTDIRQPRQITYCQGRGQFNHPPGLDLPLLPPENQPTPVIPVSRWTAWRRFCTMHVLRKGEAFSVD
jgi:hypothetical protein